MTTFFRVLMTFSVILGLGFIAETSAETSDENQLFSPENDVFTRFCNLIKTYFFRNLHNLCSFLGDEWCKMILGTNYGS
ncbi:hypothetical protein R5R35_005616 [Gryllus longicercus]|uniref:Uncharacterized protein n=1 Tax=Gryllus longicercus TaxID=2509291 RepID=A0AAN9Z2R7_9ORTH